MKFLPAQFSDLSKSLQMAPQPSGLPASPPTFILSAILWSLKLGLITSQKKKKKEVNFLNQQKLW